MVNLLYQNLYKILTIFSLLLTPSCFNATHKLWHIHDYVEDFQHFFISQDRKFVVFVSEEFHYVFDDYSEILENILSVDYRKNLFIDIDESYIEIDKSIPVAGGMAGGSADAAATLLGIDALYGLGLSKDELSEVARKLGSDVPFMLHGGTAVGRGRGDEITPALSRGNYHWVIAVSSTGLSTPAVYGECDRLRTGLDIKDPSLNDELLQALLSGDSTRVGKSLNNDLQAAAISLRPALRLILDTGQEYGALGGIVSGSGPSVAFLVADEDHSLDLAVALTSSGVVGSVARAQGPVSGAKVIAYS